MWIISFLLNVLIVYISNHLTYSYKIGHIIKDIIKTSKHDENCFTQGLVIDEKEQVLYESCGLYGKSALRKIDLKTFKILKNRSIPNWIFAEGITFVNNLIFMLSWKNKLIFIYDAHTLRLVGKRGLMTKNGEGWGITTDGRQLIVSDGTDYLSYYDIPTIVTPTNSELGGGGGGAGGGRNTVKHETSNVEEEEQLVKIREVRVYDPVNTRSISHINELEYVNGFIFANIWYQDIIIQINPENGHIVERYDLSKVFPHDKRNAHADCLNGIAYNSEEKSFLVTGKLWSKYFHINFTKAFEEREYL